MQRGNACSWMAWTPPVRPLRSDTKAPANSTANTAASSANPPCGTFGPSAPQALCPSSRSATGQPPSNPVANKHAVAFCGLKILRFHAERLDFLLSVCVQSALPVLHTRHFDKAVRPSLIVLDHREIHSIFDAKLLEVGRIGRLDLFPFAALLISVTFKAVGGRGPRRCLVCLLRVHNLAVQDDLSPVGAIVRSAPEGCPSPPVRASLRARAEVTSPCGETAKISKFITMQLPHWPEPKGLSVEGEGPERRRLQPSGRVFTSKCSSSTTNFVAVTVLPLRHARLGPQTRAPFVSCFQKYLAGSIFGETPAGAYI